MKPILPVKLILSLVAPPFNIKNIQYPIFLHFQIFKLFPFQIVLTLLLLTTAVTSQTIVSYRYDNTGKRTERVIALKSARPELLNDTIGQQKQKEIFEDNIGNQKITIYPNPTRGELKVEISGYKPDTKSTIRLYTLSGKLLMTWAPGTNVSSLDLSAYPAGTYVLKIILDDKVGEWKVVKE